MRTTRVLIADDEMDLAELLADAIRRVSDLSLAGVAHDGEQALALIDQVKPDVVLLDMIMPKLDGIAVLEELKLRSGPKPKVIALTALGEAEMTQKILALGASYYIIKPFKTDLLLRRIRQVAQEKPDLRPLALHHPNVEVERKVVELVIQIGIPPSLKGYNYVKDAILIVLENPAYLTGVTKKLYPYIAEKYGTTAGVVERALRSAIEYAWMHGDPDYLYSLFGSTIKSSKGKPTNTAFIARVADLLKYDSSTA
ncbi:MAG: sporulation transcription factor Spo0A [Firmicutes bacterium]|nr:sporulation transcription factor Spo0A [Bacillota bacterium]